MVLSTDLDSAQSAVATFDLDLSPFRNGTVMLLAAVIRAGATARSRPCRCAGWCCRTRTLPFGHSWSSASTDGAR